MSTKVSPVPEGYSSVTPYLIVKDAVAAISFYQRAFNAQELFRHADHEGKIGHAEIKIGNAIIMLADEFLEMGCKSPIEYGGSPVSLLIYADNVDDLFQQAINAGGEIVTPVEDKFYGDRMGSLKDPFGHSWHIATHIEDLSMEEIDKRMREQFNK